MSIYPVWVAVTDCPIAFQKELKRIGVTEKVNFVINGTAATVHYFEYSGAGYVFMCADKKKFKGKTKTQIISLIIHESVHVWQNCMLFLGEKCAGSEIEAYGIQWISQCCINALLK